MTPSYRMSSEVTRFFTSITPHGIPEGAMLRPHRNSSVLRNKVRDLGEVSLFSSCHDASTDLQNGIPRAIIRSGHLTRHEVKFSKWPHRVKIYTLRCVSTRGIRWWSAFFSIFRSSKLTRKNVDHAEKQHLFFVMPCKRRIATQDSNIGYGWIQNTLSIRFVFVAKLYCN